MTYKIELGGKPCPWLVDMTAQEVQAEIDDHITGYYRVFEEEAQDDELLGSIFPDVTVQFPRKPIEWQHPAERTTCERCGCSWGKDDDPGTCRFCGSSGGGWSMKTCGSRTRADIPALTVAILTEAKALIMNGWCQHVAKYYPQRDKCQYCLTGALWEAANQLGVNERGNHEGGRRSEAANIVYEAMTKGTRILADLIGVDASYQAYNETHGFISAWNDNDERKQYEVVKLLAAAITRVLLEVRAL